MKKGNLSCLAADALTRKIGGLSKDTGTFLQDYFPYVLLDKDKKITKKITNLCGK